MTGLRLNIAGIVFCAVALGGCIDQGRFYSKVEGTVTERDTSAPIAGASILLAWEATFGVHSISTVCTWVAVAETGANGRFSIFVEPSKMKAFNTIAQREMRGGFPRIRFFKAGMTPWDDYFLDTNSRQLLEDAANRFLRFWKPLEVTTTANAVLVKSPGDSHDRIRELLRLSQPEPNCANYDDPVRIKRFHEAIAAEANALALTAYEKALAEVIAARAASSVGPGSRSPSLMDVIRNPQVFSVGDGDARDAIDRTSLMRAAQSGDSDKVAALLREGSNPNRTTFQGDGLHGGYSALTMAIEKFGSRFGRGPDDDQDLRVVKALLADKATDPNRRNGYRSYTPLMSAVVRSQEQVVELLLQAGADPNTAAAGDTALTVAESKAKVATPTPAASTTYQLILQSPRLARRPAGRERPPK